MKTKIKYLSFSLVIAMMCSLCSTTVLNAESIQTDNGDSTASYEEMVETLVENGYTQDTAEALEESDAEYVYEGILSETVVDIYTCSMEIDDLAEIESFYSYTEDELIELGMTEEEIQETSSQVEEMYNMSDLELQDTYGLSETEIKLFRMAVDSGKSNKEEDETYGKEIENYVSASGSITSSEMTYTQAVTSNSTSKPNYIVKLSYKWKEVYALAAFKDKIVAAWGGSLNTKNLSGSAKYYNWSTIGGSYGSTKVSTKAMSVEVTPNAGVEFTFPQSNGTCSNGNKAKTKSGSATFTLYQTKKDGYDTTLISNYCHRVISIQSASIDISASGPSVSLSIGGAWDKTSQKRTTIGY